MTKRDISNSPPDGIAQSPPTQPSRPRNTFPKAERLCKRLAFERLFAKGSSFTEGPWWVISESPFPPELSSASLMIAIAVPKRQFKAAVKRNRIKRLVREAHRTQKHALQAKLEQNGHHMAFLIKFTGRRLPTQEETSRALRKILLRLSEKA